MSPADKWVDTLTPTNDHLPMQQQPGGFGPPPAGFGNPPPAGFGASPSPYGGPPAGGFGPGQFPAPPPLPRQTHTMAIVSLVAGIVSWFMCPFIGGIVALICGFMARKDIAKDKTKWDGDSLALAGMIVGGLNVIGYLLVGILYLLMFVGAFSLAIFGS